MFEELMAKKNIVLVRGDIIDGKLSEREAKDVMKNFFEIYQNPDLYYDLAYKFNHQQGEFSYDFFKNKFSLNDY